MTTNHVLIRTAIFAALFSAASTLACPAAAASSGTAYPELPDLPGADIQGEARIIIHLDHDVPLVEVDGQLYTLGGRPLEVAFDGLDSITLLFAVPPGASVFVFEDGLWTTNLEPSPTSKLLAFDVFDEAFRALTPLDSDPEEYGFEIALPGQPAPTVPDVVIRPTDDDPDPS